MEGLNTRRLVMTHTHTTSNSNAEATHRVANHNFTITVQITSA